LIAVAGTVPARDTIDTWRDFASLPANNAQPSNQHPTEDGKGVTVNQNLSPIWRLETLNIPGIRQLSEGHSLSEAHAGWKTRRPHRTPDTHLTIGMHRARFQRRDARRPATTGSSTTRLLLFHPDDLEAARRPQGDYRAGRRRCMRADKTAAGRDADPGAGTREEGLAETEGITGSFLATALTLPAPNIHGNSGRKAAQGIELQS
jgi:hypothetical protein